MGRGKGRRRNTRAPRPHLPLRRFAWAMLAVALLLGIPSALAGNESIFIWVDVGLCLLLAGALFLVGVRGEDAPPPARRPGGRAGGHDPHRWRNTALVASAVITILSPAVKLFVEVGERALKATAAEQRECKAAWPPAKDPPS
jgi:hypothetical protein